MPALDQLLDLHALLQDKPAAKRAKELRDSEVASVEAADAANVVIDAANKRSEEVQREVDTALASAQKELELSQKSVKETAKGVSAQEKAVKVRETSSESAFSRLKEKTDAFLGEKRDLEAKLEQLMADQFTLVADREVLRIDQERLVSDQAAFNKRVNSFTTWAGDFSTPVED